MNWVIIGILLLSLIGSMLWMMPSPKQRHQAKIRQRAMQAGLQIQMVNLQCPRAIGEAEAEQRHCMAYRLPRGAGKPVTTIVPWQLFKLNGHATIGAPAGWCWGKGEGALNSDALAAVAELITRLPQDTFAVESTPLALSFYWGEQAPLDIVDDVKQVLEQAMAAGL